MASIKAELSLDAFTDPYFLICQYNQLPNAKVA